MERDSRSTSRISPHISPGASATAPRRGSTSSNLPTRTWRAATPRDSDRPEPAAAVTSPAAGLEERPLRRRGSTARASSRRVTALPAAADEAVAEPTLDAEVAARRAVVVWRGDLHDLLVLDVQRERAADAAVRADRVDLPLLLLVPAAGGAALVFAREHQRARRAHLDAVAAVDARRVGQRDVELGRDVGVEAAPGDGDRERVLVVGAARLDAAVAEDALRVVAHVQVVVDLRRLRDGCGVRAEATRPRFVLLDVAQRIRRGRQVDRRAEQLEHEAATRADALAVGV